MRLRLLGFNLPLRWPMAVVSLCMASAWVRAETEFILRDGVAVATGGRMVRTPFHTDPIEARIVSGTWTLPQPGESVTLPGGTNRVWEAVTAKEDGNFSHPALRGGYVEVPYVSDADRILLLRASGHTMAYVNGEPRAGDVYRNGTVSLPIAVRRGTNDLLFATARGGLSVRLAVPEKPLAIDVRDTTFPDLVLGQRNDTHGAVILVNASTNTVRDLVLVASVPGGETTETPVRSIPALGTHKAGFRIVHRGKAATNRVALNLTLRQRGKVADTARFDLALKPSDQTRRETFVSGIDGSVQYYGFVPARPLPGSTSRPGLVLSTHGASVEAAGQAACYAPKTWVHVAAPTNRRPYGFDWEDWGRRDAIEVLELVQQKYGTDRSRTYLTGHSMGGHGTWQLGVTFPDRFAALAPSAGWISFASYGGGRRPEPTNELQRLIHRAWTPGDTLVLATNYLHHGIYILHGDADDNVPVSEARTMRRELGAFHPDFQWHEQPGAGHWWGNACLDWPPIFDLFGRRQIPEDHAVGRVRFATANPGISASSHWVTIEAQQQALARSSVDITWDGPARRFSGVTENVRRLSFSLAKLPPGSVPVVELDGQSLTNLTLVGGADRIFVSREEGQWKAATASPLSAKGPHRAGPFKEGFMHRMLFVYATRGTPAENAWAFAKARFDSESFWYRGNASIELVADTAFDATRDRDRGVVLYGNADNNAAWAALLGDSPVQVRRDSVRVGGREIQGDDLTCLFLRPRPGSDVACVAAVSGTGLTGLRLTDRVPYFMAGVAFPDVTVFGSDALEKGWLGARAAGYFGQDWTVESGEFAWATGVGSR
jgi:poly(3-hydroxybutyrate) depolymerase